MKQKYKRVQCSWIKVIKDPDRASGNITYAHDEPRNASYDQEEANELGVFRRRVGIHDP